MAPSTVDRSLVGEGSIEWPDAPTPGTPPDATSLVGARTDDELLAALKPPPGHDPDAPVFVLFGSTWCTHCHALLQAFDTARVEHTGGGGVRGARRRRWPWSTRAPALEPAAGRAPSPSAPRFVAATVDFMADAAAHVRFTPTVAVYRRGRVVDAWHGADAGKLSDRVWLWAGCRRAGVAGAVVGGGREEGGGQGGGAGVGEGGV